MTPLDVYRIGRPPAWVRRLQRRVGERRHLNAAHWRLLSVLDGFPVRNVAGRWIGPRWQVEWPGCQRALRAWTRSGAYRKGGRAYEASHDAAA